MIQQPRRPRHRTTASAPSSSSFPTTPWPPRLHHQLLLPSPLPALLQLQLLLFFLFLCCWAEPSRGHLFSSVCQFPPIDDWLTCQRDQGGAGSSSAGGSAEPAAEEPPPLLNGWFCDPEYSMSMSEVTALDESVRRLYAQHGRSQCVCPASRHPPPVPMPAGEEGEEAAAAATSAEPEEAEAGFDEEHGHCWHRFAFAFVHQLRVGPDVLRADQCLPRPANESGSEEAAPNSLEAQRRFELPPDWENRPDESFALFGQNFARVLRERWALGRCGEDLLILVVQQPPVQQMSAGPMSSASSRLFGALPMLFIAPGPLVQQQLGSLQLEQFVHEANSQLQREARPLHRVLGHLLVRLGVALARAHQQPAGGGATHMRPKLRSHVPLWAWAVFGACGVAFGLMALGLFLIRTGTRRSNASNGQQQGSQSGMVARRHWKEGDEPPPPQTYVNLVQMLMPHPKPAPTNMPQQV